MIEDISMVPTINSFKRIYDFYYRMAFLFTKSYVNNDLVAEDITIESLTILWMRFKEKDSSCIRPLLFRILKNKSLDYLKHEEVKRKVFCDMERKYNKELNLRLSTSIACDPEELFLGELYQIIRDTLNLFSIRTRRIFEMSRFENRSNKEIAVFWGLTVKGVDYHINKVLKVLRVKLNDY